MRLHMSPLAVADKMEVFGGWYTYWSLLNEGYPITQALWLLWVAHKSNCYRQAINK